MPVKLVICPMCKGRKTIDTEMIVEARDGTTTTTPITDVPCFICDARGKVTPAVAKFFNEQDDLWCECPESEDKSMKVVFHPDTPELKHHYTCGVCGKLVQIG